MRSTHCCEVLENCWWKYWDKMCSCLVWTTHSWSFFKHSR